MAITPREAALAHALRRCIEELDATWPPARVVKQNALDVLDGRISPADYLKAVADRREVA